MTLTLSPHNGDINSVHHFSFANFSFVDYFYYLCFVLKCFLDCSLYNSFLVYCRELAPGTVSLTGDRAHGDDSKHDSHYSPVVTCWKSAGLSALL